MQLRRILLCLVVVAAASLACSSLGLGQGPTPTPVPTIDLPTPVVPTLTPTPEPTATSTPEPSPTPTPEIDASKIEYWVDVQDDGTSIFTDRVLGYQLVFGPEWYVLPMDEDMGDMLFDNAQEQLSEELAQMIEAVRDQVGVRMIALDDKLALSSSALNATNVNAIYQEESTLAGLDMNFIIQANAEMLPTIFTGSTVSEVGVHTNPLGFEYGRLVLSHPAETMGAEMNQIMVIFKLENGILAVTCTVTPDMYSVVAPVFQQIVDSFEWVPVE